MIKNIEDRKNIVNRILLCAGLFLIAILFLTIHSYSTSPRYHWYYSDAGNYMLEGILVKKGLIPYVDFFEHKGPLIFLIEYLGCAFTDNERFGIFLVQIPFCVLTVCGAYKILRIFYKQRTAFMATIFSMIIAAPFYYGNFTEEYCAPFLVWSTYFIVRYIKYDEKSDGFHKPKYAFFYGITVMVCALIRVTNALPVCILIVIGVCILIHKRAWKNIVENVITFCIGAGITALPFVVWYAKKNALYEMLYGAIIHNIKYTSSPDEILLHDNIVMIIILNADFILSFAIAVICFIKAKEERVICITIIIATVLGVIFQLNLRPYSHYVYIWIPIYIMTVGIMGKCLKGEKKLLTVIIVTVCVSIDLVSIMNIYKGMTEGIDAYQKKIDKEAVEITELIPENERDSVLAYNVHSQYYIASDIVPCYKYFMLQDWMGSFNDELKKEFKEFISSNQVKYIIENGEKNAYSENVGPENDLDYLIEPAYEEIGRNDSFVLLRRK